MPTLDLSHSISHTGLLLGPPQTFHAVSSMNPKQHLPTPAIQSNPGSHAAVVSRGISPAPPHPVRVFSCVQSLASSAKAGTESYGSFYGSPRLFQVICQNKIRCVLHTGAQLGPRKDKVPPAVYLCRQACLRMY